MLQAGLSFREGHFAVGRIVGEAMESGISLTDAARCWLAKTGLVVDLEGLDAEMVARTCNQGGGPGVDSLAQQIAALRSSQVRFRRALHTTRKRHRRAFQRLMALCRRLGQDS